MEVNLIAVRGPCRRWVRAAVLAAVASVALLAPSVAGAATITPSINTDELDDSNSDCSLREAISIANLDSTAPEPDCAPTGTLGDDTIQLQPATVYAIASADDATPDDNEDGDFDILLGSGDLTIQGGGNSGPGATVIDPGQMSRAFNHRSNDALTLRDLRIEDGLEDGTQGAPGGGGAIGATSGAGKSLTLERVTITGNTADSAGAGGGGGIHTTNPTTLSITDSVITNNTASGVVAGGGIFAQNGLTLTDSQVSGNQATDATATQGGGGIKFGGAGATITNSTISGNTAGGGGGGGIFRSQGPLSIDNSTISGNQALTNFGAGGGIRFTGGTAGDLTITDSTVAENEAVWFGGGIAHTPQNAGTKLEVKRSAVVDNTLVGRTAAVDAIVGGGVFSGGNTSPGETLIEDTVVARNLINGTNLNDSANGAGLAFDTATTHDAEFTVRRSTIADNGGGEGSEAVVSMLGGGLYSNTETSLKVVNTTISGNHGDDATGTVEGAGLFALDVPTTVVHSTFSGNVGKGIHGDAMRASTDAAVDVRGTVVDNGPNACSEASGGSFTSQGYNLDAGATCSFTVPDTDAENTPGQLGPLADNGGPLVGSTAAPERLRTHAISVTGPAFNRVPTGNCLDEDGSALATDARGVARPQLSACDSGAFELAPPPAPSPPTTVPVHPSAFDFAKVKRNKKKGIAFLIVNVPGPGQVGLTGKGIKNRPLFSALAGKSVSTAGAG